MIRGLLASILTLAFLALFAQARPSAGNRLDLGQVAPKAGPKDEGSSESRRAIIDRIKANQERVRKLLGDNDSGEHTRKLQRQIADDLAKLLEAPDDPHRNPSAAGGDSGRPSQLPPVATEAPSGPTKERDQAKMPATKLKGVGFNGEEGPKRQDGEPAGGSWRVELPARVRQEVEAYPRDRLMPRYEELLRAYYRTIAENAPGKPGDQP